MNESSDKIERPAFDPEHPTRHLTGEERLQQALHLYHAAWEMKKAGLRAQHPDSSEE